jgi:hypothetical protein
MSRLVPAAVVAAALTVSPALAAGHSGTHTVTRAYAGGGVQGVAGATPYLYGYEHGQDTSLQGVEIPTLRTDRKVTVRVTDQSGLNVLAVVIQKAYDELGAPERELGQVCGSPKRMRLAYPGRPLNVYLVNGTCGSAPSVATTGTVAATLARR